MCYRPLGYLTLEIIFFYYGHQLILAGSYSMFMGILLTKVALELSFMDAHTVKVNTL